MSLSSCAKCWDTPCTCGWGYRDYNRDARIKLAAVVLGIQPAILECCVKAMVPEHHPMKEKK